LELPLIFFRFEYLSEQDPSFSAQYLLDGEHHIFLSSKFLWMLFDSSSVAFLLLTDVFLLVIVIHISALFPVFSASFSLLSSQSLSLFPVFPVFSVSVC
jgi:hypothetical protein